MWFLHQNCSQEVSLGCTTFSSSACTSKDPGINYLQKFHTHHKVLVVQIIKAAKSDSRLANNNLPLDIQKLRCRVSYDALRFAPKIEAFGKVCSSTITWFPAVPAL
jgi:hypothetical protein